jgi:death-on-curing protein
MSEPVWIHERVALAAHQRQMAEHGGRRLGHDAERLAQALAWPKNLLSAAEQGLRGVDLAAAYAEAALKFRPFDEGNAGVALLWAMLFLRLNGLSLPAPLGEKYAIFKAMASGEMNRASLAEWMSLRHLANEKNARTVVRVRVSKNKVTRVTVLNPPPGGISAVPSPA